MDSTLIFSRLKTNDDDEVLSLVLEVLKETDPHSWPIQGVEKQIDSKKVNIILDEYSAGGCSMPRNKTESVLIHVEGLGWPCKVSASRSTYEPEWKIG